MMQVIEPSPRVLNIFSNTNTCTDNSEFQSKRSIFNEHKIITNTHQSFDCMNILKTGTTQT